LSLYPAYAAAVSTDGITPDRKTPFFSGIQTNSTFFNWKKMRNYPYSTGTRPNGFGSFSDGTDQQCYGCGDFPAN
jgi:hypothetical protein